MPGRESMSVMSRSKPTVSGGGVRVEAGVGTVVGAGVEVIQALCMDPSAAPWLDPVHRLSQALPSRATLPPRLVPMPAAAPANHRTRRVLVARRIGWTAAAAVALLLAILLSLAVGARAVAPSAVFDALLNGGRATTPRSYGSCGCPVPSSV